MKDREAYRSRAVEIRLRAVVSTFDLGIFEHYSTAFEGGGSSFSVTSRPIQA